MKITPAHDFNDFEVGRRHHLPMINVLDREAQARPRRQIDDSCEGVPASAELDETLTLDGLDRFAARKQDRRAAGSDWGCWSKIEPHTHMVPHGDRSGVVDRAAV